MMGIDGRDLWQAIYEAINHFDPLHEGMILIADLVFPKTKTSS
jgi:hypothetical protein